jgi:hypothetical protein
MARDDETRLRAKSLWQVRRPAVWAWVAIALAIVFQYGLFRQYALREVVWAYPAAHDQTFYLSISYDAYEHILNEGLIAGLRYGVDLPAIGLLLHLQASLLYFVLGPERLSALTVNFLYFALLQVVLAWTLHWLTRRWSVVCIGLGLLLSSLTPFFRVGGLMDFRMDFAAMCVFGILLCVVIRSRLFASPRWSLLVGAIAAYLIVLRFLTAVYLTGIAGLFVVFLLARLCWLRGDAAPFRLEWRRLLHIGLASLVVATAVLPIIYWRFDVLRRYYVEGHLTGEEKHIRALMDGHELLYYPRSLLQDHAGSSFVKLAALALLTAALLALYVRARRLPRTAAEPARMGFRTLSLVLLALMLIVPTVVLTIDMHRSPVVAEIMLVPLLWLVLLALTSLVGLPRGERRPLFDYSLSALAGVALLSAGITQLCQYGRHGELTRDRANMDQVLALHDLLGEAVRQRGIHHAVVATTSNADYLTFEATETLVYERHGFYCKFESPLRKLAAVSQDEALACLRGSRFVLLTRPEQGRTPFDKAMISLSPWLRDYCEKNLTHLKTFRIFDSDIAVYVRDSDSDRNESEDVPNEVATGEATGPLSR